MRDVQTRPRQMMAIQTFYHEVILESEVNRVRLTTTHLGPTVLAAWFAGFGTHAARNPPGSFAVPH